jgi:replicative DNA helicase
MSSTLSKLDEVIYITQSNLNKRKRQMRTVTNKLEMSEFEKVKVGFETELITNVEFLIKEIKNDVNRSLGKAMPQALDMEEAVLGAIMLEKPAMEVVEKYLLPEHFYSEGHRIIYEACKMLHVEHSPIDMRTVVDKLRKFGKIELVGGPHRIAEITSKVSSAANIEYHARIIMEHAIKREITKLIGLGQWAYDDTRDCFELLGEVEDHIKKIQSWIK